ncbi:hypothetical protein LIER_38993 [Lithospermum erythrorhizon]|uniref:Uncharacterized protein n=1 Tax=Lithospermum erythrorhizon TaxID=34254 RepID=A0AAV3QDE6_LITER
MDRETLFTPLIRTNFVKWVTNNWETDTGPQIRLSPSKVLKITQDDVHRVYHLSRGDKRVDISQCTDDAIKRLRDELGIGGSFSRTDVRKYNWCQHVFEHTTKGITVNNKLNPTANFHFLLINYLERMSKQCPLLTGQFTTPSLSGWDESSTVASLLAMEEMVELSKAVAVSVIKERRSEDVRVLMSFDPETCPMEKVPKFVAYCKGQTDAYNDYLAILNRSVQKDIGREKQRCSKTDLGQPSNEKKEKRKKVIPRKHEDMLRHKKKSKRDGDGSDLAIDKVEGKSKIAYAINKTRFQQETSNVVKHHIVEERFKVPPSKMYVRKKKRCINN